MVHDVLLDAIVGGSALVGDRPPSGSRCRAKGRAWPAPWSGGIGSADRAPTGRRRQVTENGAKSGAEPESVRTVVRMGHPLATVLRWTGRILIVLGVLVLVASLFFPEAVQPLNPYLCPEGTELDNARYTPPGTPGDPKLELVCTGPKYTETVGQKVLLVTAGLIVLGLASIYLSQRASRQKFNRPAGPATH